MGMPVTVEIADTTADRVLLESVFSYFMAVDERFSTYKKDSEISRINQGKLKKEHASNEMKEIFALAEKTKKETGGYFNIQKPDGSLDPSGVVKGWAIRNTARLILDAHCEHFYVDAGGDIQPHGKNTKGDEWTVGIRDPFRQHEHEIVKVIYPRGAGVATSGTYIRGQHIYNPHAPEKHITDIVSLTVVGPDICEADRFSTAAFAMGKEAIHFIQNLPGFEGYMIDAYGIASMTTGFRRYADL